VNTQIQHTETTSNTQPKNQQARETKIKAERVARVEAARMHLWQQKEKQLESLQKKHDRKARQLNTMVQARKAIMSSAGDAGMLLGETAAVRAAAQTISALTDYTSQVLVGGVGKKW
jgi:transcriptional regulator with GAF, ATPase, and Fis domain